MKCYVIVLFIVINMNNSSLELIIGPMMSGKSTELIRRIRRHQVIGNKVLIINSCSDVRCGNEIKTHDNKIVNAEKFNSLMDCKTYSNYDVVAIDEAQFFEDLLEFTNLLLDNNKHVIITGLNGDSEQKKFGFILDLIPKADKLDLLSGLCTICKDGTLGHFSVRNDSKNSDQIFIGGSDSYQCVCRKHI